MKHQMRHLRNIGDGRMKYSLRLSLFLALALFMSTAFAQFYGFASYQDYLNNYYGQSAYQSPQNPSQIRSVVYTPYTAPVTTTPAAITTNPNTSPYNGFASYQDYLDNFYAGQNVPSPSVDPCGFAQTMSIFVSANDDCAPANTSRATTPSTTAFNGYPSYQAYLDAFYAGQTTSTTPQQTTPPASGSVTSGYYGYNSYEEYLQAFYAMNNTSAPSTSTTSPSGYDVNFNKCKWLL